jgi:protein TonB
VAGDGRAGTRGGPAWAGDGLPGGLGAREGSVLALAVPGEGGAAPGEYDGYVALLRRRVQEALTYPSAARRRELTGTVQVEVEIQPTGAIGQVRLAASSSHRVLDEAALEAVRGVDRVPFPPALRPRPLRVRLPVVFDLR